MLLKMKSIDFDINSLAGIGVIIFLIGLICFILLLLYLRFNHYRIKVNFPMNNLGSEDMLSPKEWEKQIQEMADLHKDVSLRHYSFVLDDYNQIVYKKLNKIRDRISKISTDIIALIPSARWLFDNFQMMYREIKKIRSSGTSYAVLPILNAKEYRGFPRIYVLAKKMVALSGGNINAENISIMLKAYQKEIPLTDKEVWALPELLGFCLLERIVELSEEIIYIITVKSKADSFIINQLKKGTVADINVLLQDLDEDCNNISFHSQVIYRLKNMMYEEAAIQSYIDYHFKAKGKQLTASRIFSEEGKLESQLETYIRVLIVNLREMNELDSESFFEEYSYLEHILSMDPDGVYARMDSESRGIYRGVIVALSLKYKIGEEKIADNCLALARLGRDDLNASHHVGTYLLGKGYPILKAQVRNKPIPSLIRKKKNIKGFLYFVSCFLFFLGFNAVIVTAINLLGAINEPTPYIITLLIALPILIGIAQEVTNFIFTRCVQVKRIPSLDYMKEIPEGSRTFVVMPVIISSGEQGLEYLNRLQKHYLANRQENLYFALLADYEDSSEEVLPKDDLIKNALINRINELNEMYPHDNNRFHLFIRIRKWNKAENCYMGWERKRGKLEEFNSLLSGVKKEATTYSYVSCDRDFLTSFQYVITLDADTNLLRDTAAKLVGLIDHPLNRPVLDEEGKCVKEGYVIIQPSVRNHIPDRNGSSFVDIFGGQCGLEHYGTLVSDIYQDIFNKGTYIGKGIYDFRAFHTLLHNVIPENRVLSHDLLESCYARTAFSSTAKVMDTFPATFLSYAKREHRWIRGDWQLVPWLFKRLNRRPLCALSKWKIVDNLRRSLVPLSKTLLILINLMFFPTVWYLWLPIVFFIDIFHLIVYVVSTVIQKLLRPKLALVYKSFFRELSLMLKRSLLEFVITPYRAYIATDAMLRTLYRLLISKKNLLQWKTAESVDASISNTKRGYFLNLWSSMVPAILLLFLLMVTDISYIGIFAFSAVILVWGVAYYFAYSISLPKNKEKEKEWMAEKEFLLEVSRRTWMFFKEFSTEENHWLCPDNYQRSQVEKVSDKTSPTNIGLQLLSILSARDFGYETLSTMLEMIERLLETVRELPKWKGHLYNWYHIKSLEVLNPAYISTVDSGNFLGHLIALKHGLMDQLEQPVFPPCLIAELRKTAKLSQEERTKNSHGDLAVRAELKEQYGSIGEFVEELTDIWESLHEIWPRQQECPRWTRELMHIIEAIVKEAADFKLKSYPLSSCPGIKQLAANNVAQAKTITEKIKELCNKIDCLEENADFRFLFNEKRMLFHIGYHVSSDVLDTGCYDLMASEAALTSFLAIARGEVPLRHWNKLGRPLTLVRGTPCFTSWSGTMFEYLMPNLVLKSYEGSVYDESYKAAVLQHMKYAKEAGIPWGISESQYYRFDLNSNYQYKAFGVPKLRLQPVRVNPYVVTPYASMLALEYAGAECIENLKVLEEQGGYGVYGFYEAIDYTVPNSIDMTPYCIVRSFMAHHQGMILVAINNFLNQGIMRRRFHSEAMIRATEVLLEEKRQSNLISLAKRGYTVKIGKVHSRETEEFGNRYINTVEPKIPAVNYLSHNNYSLLITSDGDGFSKYKNMMLHRWRADRYANTGNYIYIKDVGSNKFWSASYHPTRIDPEEYQVIFAPHRAEFHRVDQEVATKLIVSLSPDHNMEIRRLTLSNHSKEEKSFEITSYLEVVCDTHLAELSHPAFNKLFIESEFLTEHEIFLSKRRSSKNADNPYLMHMVKTDHKLTKRPEYENDRMKFIGRNHSPENPVAVADSIALSNNSGFCNDPIMSLRVSISLQAGQSANISFITGICHTKEEAIKIKEELKIPNRIEDIFEKFRLQSEIELKYLDITGPQLHAFQELISPIYYPSRFFRGPHENIRRNYKNQSFLWRFGVSGDNPIMLLRVESIEDAQMIRNVLKAYEYLKVNRVTVDLIILSDAKHGYMQELDDLVNDLTTSLRIYNTGNDKPSLFMLHSYEMIPSEIDLLYTVARVVFSERTGIYFKNLKEKMNESTDGH